LNDDIYFHKLSILNTYQTGVNRADYTFWWAANSPGCFALWRFMRDNNYRSRSLIEAIVAKQQNERLVVRSLQEINNKDES
jgi:hypothetical protein